MDLHENLERLVRDGDVTVGGKKVNVVNNKAEVTYADETDVIPNLTVNFNKEVKVQAIEDKAGVVYNTAAQFETAKEWLGYTGDLTAFTKNVTLTGSTKTYADVIAKLGDSFKVTVVDADGNTLTVTINLKLYIPSATVKELKGTVVQVLAGVYAVTIDKAQVVAEFGITETEELLLKIGDAEFTLKYNDAKQVWASGSIQNLTEDEINNGVITVK